MLFKKAMLLVTVLFGAMTLAGCVTTGSQGTDLSIPCDALSPMTWSHKDTTKTQRQIIGYNATGKKLCKWHGHPTGVLSRVF